MKKILFIFVISLYSIQGFAGACQNGANASGCSIGTDDTSYNLTGNIAVTGGTYSNSWNNSTDDTAGIEFTTGSDSNDMSLTGDISTTGYRSFGLSLESSDSNTVNLTGDITTTGTYGYAISLDQERKVIH